MKTRFALLLLLSLCSCRTLVPMATPADASGRGGSAADIAPGTYDNHEQVWSARESAAHGLAPPHVAVTVESASSEGWSLWHVRYEGAGAPLGTDWAIRHAIDGNGVQTLVPYRPLTATPAPAAKFDASQWTPLDACALRRSAGKGVSGFAADAASCSAIAPGLGAQMALLPVSIESEGEWLHVRFYADQARGVDVREDARRVRLFTGWAAINGGGPNAAADSSDWHLDRSVRIGSEGGRWPLHWRDGAPSGYSLALERLTYREGNVPVLKLSVIGDDDGHTVAYAWANPEATRIGINLGWVQVGLQFGSTPGAADTAAKQP